MLDFPYISSCIHGTSSESSKVVGFPNRAGYSFPNSELDFYSVTHALSTTPFEEFPPFSQLVDVPQRGMEVQLVNQVHTK